MICRWRADQLFAEAEASSNNRPLPTSKNPHFQNEAKCTTFLVKMSFICVRMNTHFHIKGWAANLVLIQTPGGTRKWPIDLRNTDRSRYFAITEFNNCFIIRSLNLFKGEKRGFIYAWAEHYLQPNKVGRHCTRGDHYLYAVICRSRDALSANEKEEKFASIDNITCLHPEIPSAIIIPSHQLLICSPPTNHDILLKWSPIIFHCRL